MFAVENLALEVIWIIASICLFLIGLKTFIRYYKLKKNAQMLEHAELTGLGSMVSHGMIYDKNRGVGVKPDARRSDNWFKNLL